MAQQEPKSLIAFLPCDDCGRPDVCEKLGECNLLIPPAVESRDSLIGAVHIRAVDSIPNPRGCVQWCPLCVAEEEAREVAIIRAHVPTVWMRPSQGSREAECSCGWKGPKRTGPERALDDWREHVDEVRGG